LCPLFSACSLAVGLGIPSDYQRRHAGASAMPFDQAAFQESGVQLVSGNHPLHSRIVDLQHVDDAYLPVGDRIVSADPSRLVAKAFAEEIAFADVEDGLVG
jgi:hypothetical protein